MANKYALNPGAKHWQARVLWSKHMAKLLSALRSS